MCYLVHHYHPSLLPLELISDETSGSQSIASSCLSPANFSCSKINWSASFSPTTGINPKQELFLTNEKSNFKALSKAINRLGGIPLLAQYKDMSQTLPDEKVVIAYVSYLCHHLFLLRKEGRAAKCIQQVWKRHRVLKKTVLMNSAATKLQAWYRAMSHRKKYQRLLAATLKIQNWWKNKLTVFATQASLALNTSNLFFLLNHR